MEDQPLYPWLDPEYLLSLRKRDRLALAIAYALYGPGVFA